MKSWRLEMIAPKLMNLLLPMALAGMLAHGAENSGTRGLLPEDVVQARPKAKAAAPATKAVYRTTVGKQAMESLRTGSAGRQIGVTIWNVRPAAAGDKAGVRLLVQESAESAEWVPERVAATSALRNGDRVRLTIESPEAGYLYVIDRERYASGERGAPWLIFPTSRTRGGDNQVAAGKLVEIPGQEDRPNYFSLKPGRADQVEEELTILLAPKPIEGLEPGPKATQLPPEMVTKWEKQWGAGKTEIFELVGGAGKAWTQAEQQAGADATRVLTQEDPPPQSIYRVVNGTAQDPILAKVQLRYGGR
jgi:hypothetical protein